MKRRPLFSRYGVESGHITGSVLVFPGFDPIRTSRTPSGPMIEAGFSLYQSSRLSRYDAMS
jgi:hypothetical protein